MGVCDGEIGGVADEVFDLRNKKTNFILPFTVHTKKLKVYYYTNIQPIHMEHRCIPHLKWKYIPKPEADRNAVPRVQYILKFHKERLSTLFTT